MAENCLFIMKRSTTMITQEFLKKNKVKTVT